MKRLLCAALVGAALFGAALLRAQNAPSIQLNDKEYFEAPGFSFLLFHNNYQVGYQGGLQMIQNGERLLDSGDLMLTPHPGKPPARLTVTRRTVNRADVSATVEGAIEDGGAYRLVCRASQGSIRVTLQLEQPVDWSRYAQAALRFALYPGAYMLKSFHADSHSGVFPRQFTTQRVLVPSTSRLRVAPEDPAIDIRFSRTGGELMLVDNRAGSPSPWFQVLAPIRPGSTDTSVDVTIQPNLLPGYRRTPVIGVSQVGFHPGQPKRAVIELDPRDADAAPVLLYKWQLNGDRIVAKRAAAKAWGRFLRYKYEIFDFSEIREPGVYTLETRQVTAGPFRIDPSVLDDAWKPTLQYFLPIQMCHVAVLEGTRTWHGACHLDDARQAPPNTPHLDGYQQGALEARFAGEEHIPGLNYGGWHDAGDLDVPAGSLATTTLFLALAQEEFRPAWDTTTVNRGRREVRLHVPDGQSDLLQQVEYGVEGLLASYRAAGYIFAGIIERNRAGYGHLGDPVNVTDNLIDKVPYDDRWVFTNRNTGLQYRVAQTLAAASRVLRESNPLLAAESLRAAQSLFAYEQTHPPVYAPNAYVPRDSGFRSEEIAAAAELLLSTGDALYRERLTALLPELRKATVEQFASGPGFTLVRALPRLTDENLKRTIRDYAHQWRDLSARWAASNPYGVHLPPTVTNPDYRLEERTGIHSGFVWGPGWNLQADAVRQYYFHKHFPELFDMQPLLATVDFVLGCHPANNRSYVSGVGVHNPLIAYGTNRAEWSHIPGGVISGASLVKPDFFELKDFPFLWYQTEYVIGGAASFIFDLLAAQHLLNRLPS